MSEQKKSLEELIIEYGQQQQWCGHFGSEAKEWSHHWDKAQNALKAFKAEAEKMEELIGVAYVLAGAYNCPVRFLDAFSDYDSVDKPLDLLPVTGLKPVHQMKVIDTYGHPSWRDISEKEYEVQKSDCVVRIVYTPEEE